MSEENPSPNPPAPAANQNLIIGLVLGSMVLLLFLLVLNMQGDRSGSSASELSELRTLVAGKRSEINAERQRLGLAPLADDGSTATVEALASRINTDSSYLTNLAAELQRTLEEKSARAATAEASLKSLYGQVDGLERQLAEARIKSGESSMLQQKIADLETQLEADRARLAELNQQLSSAPSQEALAALEARLDQALGERTAARQRYEALQAETANMVSGDEIDELRRKILKLEPENNKLRYEVQRLQALLDRARLFVESSDDLAPGAQRLYQELRSLDSVSSTAQLNNEYTRIGTEMKASVVDTVAFGEGSSRIDFDKAEEVRRLLAKTNPDSFLLVVGYASTTGDIDFNRKLSSERASRIASVVNSNKAPGQEIQAVFLGQTKRFSTSEVARNQICEIWELRK